MKTEHLGVEEPFKSLFTQGMVIHETFKSPDGEWVLPSDAIQKDGAWVHTKTNEPLTVGGVEKMSKSKRNVVDPDTIIASYGADTARWFMLSDTPPERDIEWTEAGAEGSWRFMQKIWRIVNEIAELPMAQLSIGVEGLQLRRHSHRTAQSITDDLNNLRFNRAIARIYELSNAIGQSLALPTKSSDMIAALKEAGEFLVLLIAPMMPHLAEESWKVLGHNIAVVDTAWPKPLVELMSVDEVTIAIQVNGKRRDEITVQKGLTQVTLEPLVLALENVKRAMEGRVAKKIVVVPDRIVNIVC